MLSAVLLSARILAGAEPVDKRIQHGLAAIERQNYDIAAESFRGAVEKSGPGVYLTIGKAEGAIPGREVRAVCWLGAYLAAEPKATDATVVKAEIDALTAKHRERCLQLTLRMADSDANRSATNEEAREEALRDLAYQWGTVGDFDAARRVIGLMQTSRKTDALTTLVRAEADEAATRFGAGDAATSARLLADAEKDAAGSPRIDYDMAYGIAMARLQIARDLIARGNLADARGYIDKVAADAGNHGNAETVGSLATTKLVMARAQIKAGQKDDALATLKEVVALAEGIHQNGSPLKYTVLRDLADAQVQAGDLAGARASLSTSAPLTAIYGDANPMRLALLETQLKIGDKEGAQKTAELITDVKLKAKGLEDISSPPKVEPPNPYSNAPFPSQYLSGPGEKPERTILTAAEWVAFLELNFDAPCFTAFRDDADVMAIAAEIQKEPVRLARHAAALNAAASLDCVTHRMIDAQISLDRMLEKQFGP